MKSLTLKDFKYLIDNLFKNKNFLDKLSESEDGKLLYDGEEVFLPSNLINDVLTSEDTTYSSKQIEEKLVSIINSIEVGSKDNASVYQKVFLDIVANDTKYISTANENIIDQFIIQLYKFVPGIQDTIEILKKFNNVDSSNFNYNDENVEFNGAMKIKDSHNYDVRINEDGLYESADIVVEEFVEMSGMEVIE